MKEWISKWMYECMNWWMSWMKEWINGLNELNEGNEGNECMNEWTIGSMHEWMKHLKDGFPGIPRECKKIKNYYSEWGVEVFVYLLMKERRTTTSAFNVELGVIETKITTRLNLVSSDCPTSS